MGFKVDEYFCIGLRCKDCPLHHEDETFSSNCFFSVFDKFDINDLFYKLNIFFTKRPLMKYIRR